MSKMFAEEKRIVDEDISSRVSQYDVIFEAITNSIHACATKIDCLLDSYDSSLMGNDSENNVTKLNSIIVRDNGEGLHKKNYESFCKYRTEYKRDLGCKGVGRFVFLKVYSYAEFRSSLINEQEVRTFKFDLDFDTENIQITPNIVMENFTEVSFKTLSELYLNSDKHIDRRIELNLKSIRDKVLLNLIPTLFFYK